MRWVDSCSRGRRSWSRVSPCSEKAEPQNALRRRRPDHCLGQPPPSGRTTFPPFVTGGGAVPQVVVSELRRGDRARSRALRCHCGLRLVRAGDLISLVVVPTVGSLRFPIRFQRGPSGVHHLLPCLYTSTRDMPRRGIGEEERGESKPTTPLRAMHARVPSPAQTPRGLPPAKTCWWTHSDPSAYQSPRQGRGGGACATRGRVFHRAFGRLLKDHRWYSQRRSRGRPPGGRTGVWWPTRSDGLPGRRCLRLTRELPAPLFHRISAPLILWCFFPGLSWGDAGATLPNAALNSSSSDHAQGPARAATAGIRQPIIGVHRC